MGLMFPTDIAFVGNDDLLVTEKNEGTVRRIVNETLLPDPLINLNVSTIGERGLLGIVSTKNADNQIHVFLFYSESKNRDGKVETVFRKLQTLPMERAFQLNVPKSFCQAMGWKY